MSGNCGRNSGCSRSCGFEEVVRGIDSRNGGCSGDAESNGDDIQIVGREGGNVGPYTWNGYVWYDIEVEFSGPYFGGCSRADERSRCCGTNRNCGW